ncbi:DUF1735 domain-containing protein [Sphingobacterium hungaricum]|uniref:BT-3987-like N-terminal domain-containing protein n=1 Tax=Sphingobacterium hungaricum TaxID=2082723 RepID=A0A928UX61_9SPHI|nr:DUF1735 domain-containing protein [Sphingobacterium hungaricum]MBE8713121.1 hypothetical protein [Sphingobacterium hungaricum]
MKTKFIYNILLLIPILFSSCLKDDVLIGPDAPGAITNIIEFKNPAIISSSTTSRIPLYLLSFDTSPSETMVLELNYAGSEVAPEDIHLTLAIDNSLIDIVNEDNDRELAPLDASVYDIPTFDVVIKKGERIGLFTIELFTDQFDYDHDYALGFSIVSSSIGAISGNFGKIVVGISPKNIFDGLYHIAGTMTDVSNTTLKHISNNYDDWEVELRTVGVNKVVVYDVEYSGYNYPISSGSSWSVYGEFSPVFEIDLNTYKVLSVANFYPSATNTRRAEIDPSGVNQYDPATKTLKVKYFMIQPSVIPAAPSIRSYMDDTYTFIDVR